MVPGMYRLDVYLPVRRAVMVEGMSIREAARVFGLHRDTVRKMLAYSAPPGYRRENHPRRPKLEPFTGVIDRILEDDLRLPRKQRHTAQRIFERLRDEYRKVRVVLDNPVSSTGQALNTHRGTSLYETFEPKEARRVIQRLEFHYTPKHGSWLNMAEIEFSVFSNQCLNRRIEDEESLKREVAALETERRRPNEIRLRQPSTGGSLPPTPVTSFGGPIHRFHTDEVLN